MTMEMKKLSQRVLNAMTHGLDFLLYAAPASPERMLSPAPVCVPGGPRATFC